MIRSSIRPRFRKPDSRPFDEDLIDIDPNSSTTFVYNPLLSLPYDQQRARLPIFQFKDHILYLLQNYQTLVLVGETGCGKSTQLPQYLLEAGYAQGSGKAIAITEPRRVAATSLAARVAEEKGCVLGDLVGYAIRFDDCTTNETKIKYMTEGIFMREIMSDPMLRNYSAIILDEAHERTLHTDIIMGLVKKILKKNLSLKLIVSSATVDAKEMQIFFNLSRTQNQSQDTSVIMSIPGRTYSTDIYFRKEPVPDYVKGVVDTVIKIHKAEKQGDILAFLTGQEEVDRAVTMIREQNFRNSAGLAIQAQPLHGSLPHSEQLKAFRHPDPNHRKAIIATNIAETSVTIKGIVFVVDCGFVKMRWFNPDTFIDSLAVVPISKSSAEQRAGRAGRMQTGKVFRLYSQEEYNKLADSTCCEMQRSDLSLAVLHLKALGIDNVLRFNFPSPPPAKNLAAALELLFALGAINQDGKLTTLGSNMAEFPMHPMYSKMLLASGDFACSEEILSIVSCLQVQTVFAKPLGGTRATKARVAHRKFEVEEGDLITLLNVFNAYRDSNNKNEFCQENFLNAKGLKRVVEIRERMKNLLMRFNVPMVSSGGNTLSILKAITAGLFQNAAYLDYSGEYKSIRGGQELYVHSSSVLYTLEPAECPHQGYQWDYSYPCVRSYPLSWSPRLSAVVPRYKNLTLKIQQNSINNTFYKFMKCLRGMNGGSRVLFCDLVTTNKQYIKNLTVVKPDWLEELAPHFYQKTRLLF